MRSLPRFFAAFFTGLLVTDILHGANVVGRVRDNSGHGISNLSVQATLFSSQNYTQMVATTDAAGYFDFTGDAGSWQLWVEAQSLNARGYFDVAAQSVDVAADQTRSVRFTTRKLELTHRINGRLTDAFQFPIPGVSLRASITENYSSFQITVQTAADGSFQLAASPAVWRIAPEFPGWQTEFVFPDTEIEVAETNLETTAAVVAPRATGSISGVASNLSGSEVVAQTEAHGRIYVQTTYLFGSSSPFHFPVFNGTWTVFVTNRGYRFAEDALPPPPVIVSITNSSAQIYLGGIARPFRVLQVRTLNSNGSPVTNASIYAYNEVSGFVNPPPLPGPPVGEPGTFILNLPDGKWRVTASLSDTGNLLSQQITGTITISTNQGSTLDLIFPHPETSPRIFGTVRDDNGSALPWTALTLVESGGETNHTIWLGTDANGEFSVNVTPGRWAVQLQQVAACPVQASVTVSSNDVRVDLELCRPPVNEASVSVAALDEVPEMAPEAQISLSSATSFWSTNVAPGSPATISLHPGLWSASHSASWNGFDDDAYSLHPSLTWHLLPVAATNLALIARTASSRIEGRMRDEQGHLLTAGYASARANIEGTNYTVSSPVSSGYFSLNVIPGTWEVAASTWRYPGFGAAAPVSPGRQPAISHVEPPPQFIEVTSATARCEFVASNLPASLELAVSVIREDGSLLDNAFVSVLTGTVRTTSNEEGITRLNVPPGQNLIFVYGAWATMAFEELLLPSLPIDLTAPSNHFVLVARTATTCISGTLTNPANRRLFIPIVASTQVDGTNYSGSACAGRNGRFCIPAFPGSWEVNVADTWANDLGLQSSAPKPALVPTAGEPLPMDITVNPIIGDFREARLGIAAADPNGDMRLELRGQAALTWRIERSDNLADWRSLGTLTTSNGVAVIPVAVGNSISPEFFRAIWLK